VLRFYSCRPPGRFASLIDHHHPEAQQETRQWSKKLWQAVEEVEHRALHGGADALPKFDDMLKEMVWPKNGWCREVLVALKETEHKVTPSVTEEDLLALAQSTASLISKCCFKQLSHCEHQHTAGVLGRRARWHRLLAGATIKEFDYRVPGITPESRHFAAKDIGKSVFDFKEGVDFSLGGDYVQELMSQVP